MKYLVTMGELECKCGCGMQVREQFYEVINVARNIAGVPFVISSGARCKEHNEAVGGVSDSSHVKGVACDIRVRSGYERFKVVQALMAVGFNRIGVDKGFVHVDLDEDKPANVMWTY